MQRFAASPGGEPRILMEVPSFEALYRDLFMFSWRSLRALGVPPFALEDAAQEVWFVVHRRLADFEGRSRLKTWLFGIAVNVARNWRRARSREGQLTPLEGDVVATLPDPAAACEGLEAWEIVEGFLETLDAERREVFVCGLLEGFSAPEVAQVTGLEVDIVYNRIRALRRSFRSWAQRESQER